MEIIKGKHLFQFKDLNIYNYNKIIENILSSLNDLHSKRELPSSRKEPKKPQQEIPKEFHIETKRNQRKIEQENIGKVLGTFRESQDKYGSHLVDPLG